jgi:hypothetical protein
MPFKSNAPLSIGPGYQQRGIASFWDGNSGLQFVHIKTSIPQQTYVMPMIEIIGYNYATAQPIRMAFVIYTYSYLISNWQNVYNGLIGDGVYISSDGYICLRLYASNLYYVGFSIDAYSVAGNGAGYEVGILAMTANNNPGNAY